MSHIETGAPVFTHLLPTSIRSKYKHFLFFSLSRSCLYLAKQSKTKNYSTIQIKEFKTSLFRSSLIQQRRQTHIAPNIETIRTLISLELIQYDNRTLGINQNFRIRKSLILASPSKSTCYEAS